MSKGKYHLLIRCRDPILEDDMTFFLHLLRRQEVDGNATDEVRKVEDTETAEVLLVGRRGDNCTIKSVPSIPNATRDLTHPDASSPSESPHS